VAADEVPSGDATGRLPPLIVLAGATATGKTALSLALADALGARGVASEIVSADSRQVYRGMDIGTAKATADERAAVPHHGLDLVDPDEPFSVADYTGHAATALSGIAQRGAVALLVLGASCVRASFEAAADAAEAAEQVEPEVPVRRSRKSAR